MNILICAGHTLKGAGTGAVGYINESNENRILSNLVVKYLKELGVSADYYEINEASNYLSLQVQAANKNKYDLVVQIHFNAYKTTISSMGTETLYCSTQGKVYADRVNTKLKSMYKDRGVKKRTDLYWLNNTNSPAILVEVCFVDSKNDTDMYIMNKDRTAQLIAEAIVNKSLVITPAKPEESNTFYRVVAGSFSNKSNADNLAKELKSKGYPAFVDIYKK